jgi:hypothetical protein
MTNMTARRWNISSVMYKSVLRGHIIPPTSSVPVSNQLTISVRSLQIFHPMIKMIENFRNASPVACSAATSPTTPMIPTYSKSTNSSKEPTSSFEEARHSSPLWKYCRTTGLFQNTNCCPCCRSSSQSWLSWVKEWSPFREVLEESGLSFVPIVSCCQWHSFFEG